MKILVLGGGQQGRVIAIDLSYKVNNAHVDVADVRQPSLPVRGNLRWIEADLADVSAMARRLLEEYVRPARVVREGRPASLPPFADLDRVQVPGVGEMESFLSDGLRTLIATMPDVRTMSERTLRWPGHAVAVRPLVESGRFLEELHDKCVANPPRDLVAMMTVVKRGQQVQRATLIDRYDEDSRLTAMSR